MTRLDACDIYVQSLCQESQHCILLRPRLVRACVSRIPLQISSTQFIPAACRCVAQDLCVPVQDLEKSIGPTAMWHTQQPMQGAPNVGFRLAIPVVWRKHSLHAALSRPPTIGMPSSGLTTSQTFGDVKAAERTACCYLNNGVQGEQKKHG